MLGVLRLILGAIVLIARLTRPDGKSLLVASSSGQAAAVNDATNESQGL